MIIKKVDDNQKIFCLDFISINGSESIDPDVEPGQDMALNYKWYCKQPTETIDITKPNTIPNIIPPSTSLVGKLQGDSFKGCFGKCFSVLIEFLRFFGQFCNKFQPFVEW